MKPYVKPELYFESFELAQHIAACAWDMKNQNNENNCTAEWDTTDFGGVADGQLFNANNTNCILLCLIPFILFCHFFLQRTVNIY